MIITTPNQYSLHAFRKLLRGKELIHADHVSCYSYRSLVQLLERHGYGVTEFALYHPFSGPLRWRLFERLALRIQPFYANGLIVVARVSQE